MNRRQPPRRHACVRCVRLKVRCQPVEGTGTCVRCTRLGQSCTLPDGLRASSRPRKTRIDALQEQIDNLVTQLATKQAANCQELSQPTTKPNTIDSPDPYQKDSTPHNARSDGEAEPLFGYLFTLEEADELLAKFRAQKMHHFPFVIIPPEMDVASLRDQYPFLLTCVVWASLEHNASLQLRMEGVIRQTIATRVFVNGERNMDLLQGLLVHSAWYHYHWKSMHEHQYLLLQVLPILVYDVGLDQDDMVKLQLQPGQISEPREGKHHINPAGQRALLGCYYLCHKSSIFRRHMNMRHTKCIDTCLTNLTTNPEYPSDMLLRTLIDTQPLMRKSHSLLGDELNYCNDQCRDATWEQILTAVVTNQKDLGDIKARHSLHGNWALRIELDAFPMLMLGHFLRRQKDAFYLRDINQLQPLAISAHRVAATFLAVPSAVVVHLPISTYTTWWYSMVVLAKLGLSFGIYSQLPTDLGTKSVHEVVLATVHRIEGFSLGDDLWSGCKKAIAKLLEWLEKTSNETPRSFMPPANNPLIGTTDPSPSLMSLPTAMHYPGQVIPDTVPPVGNSYQMPPDQWQSPLMPSAMASGLESDMVGMGMDYFIVRHMIDELSLFGSAAQHTFVSTVEV
ncbi:Zn(II)2Cys6 transcription factor domain-containing protein [Aspergillus homomorphus CBS 101889]|uniref:Zn(2)-C6 fungal-type domain-containing protein n=1 Tax=Aspergillus homomorphus (strain CBS 101889) TaxID=1450537 RepID=A0A395HIW0_ASPHC|nr:hypothetical protein BO97DRAFT_253868 [Aspergillus homomorphus CBS 101889]RAL07373.1 hypothetical protein BO97DRAFT_253868 [Aspergillus homomorphus CBS 101889]